MVHSGGPELKKGSRLVENFFRKCASEKKEKKKICRSIIYVDEITIFIIIITVVVVVVVVVVVIVMVVVFLFNRSHSFFIHRYI